MMCVSMSTLSLRISANDPALPISHVSRSIRIQQQQWERGKSGGDRRLILSESIDHALVVMAIKNPTRKVGCTTTPALQLKSQELLLYKNSPVIPKQPTQGLLKLINLYYSTLVRTVGRGAGRGTNWFLGGPSLFYLFIFFSFFYGVVPRGPSATFNHFLVWSFTLLYGFYCQTVFNSITSYTFNNISSV